MGWSQPVAICEGGPRDRWSYFLAEIERCRDAAAAMGSVFDYRRTGRSVPHPLDKHTRAEVWEYAPPREAAAAPPAVPRERPLEPPAPRWADDLAPARCQTCGEPVFRIQRGSGVLTLDPGIVRGGLWRFDERGAPLRRRITDVVAEETGESHGGGYAPHVCAVSDLAPRDTKD
jgi:hypothetical protein